MVDWLLESPNLVIQVGILIVGLAVVWFALRLFLRLTLRLFALGCGVVGILALCGVAYLLLTRP